MLRCRYNIGKKLRPFVMFLVVYKLFTDNILRCRVIIQTIGPGSAMTIREAAEREEVVR